MTEQLVSFPTAKLAKEKGFGLGEDDYITLPTVYELNGNLYNNGELTGSVGRKYNDSPNHLGANTINDFEANVFTMDNSLDEFILAPTQSLLQKWLREVHNLHIWLQPLGFKMQYDVYIEHIDDWKKGEENTCVGEDFNTYEEALEKGLYQALKLIKT